MEYIYGFAKVAKVIFENIRQFSKRYRRRMKFQKHQQKGFLQRNFQYNDPSQYSCLFEGSLELENKKRKSQTLKQVCFEMIEKFVGILNFDSTILSTDITRRFYSEQFRCCLINFNDISKEINRYFVQSKNQDEETKLNYAIEDISLLLLEYVKGQYLKEDILEEFIVSFAEIQEFVYNTILKRVSNIQSNAYQRIVSKLENFIKFKQKDYQVRKYLDQLNLNKIELREVKRILKIFYKDEIFLFNVYIQRIFEYQLTHVLCVIITIIQFKQQFNQKYLKQIQKVFIERVQNKFLALQSFDNNIYQSCIKQKLEVKFFEYLYFQKFSGGVTEKEINRQLQYLIYSIKWIVICQAADQAMQLLNELSNYHGNVNQKDSSAFHDPKFSVDLLNDFKYINKKKCKYIQFWWDQNINEEQNLVIIFQIFIILSKIQFKEHKLFLGTYFPAARLALIQILRRLNNGKYGYQNLTILKMCEKIAFSINRQIYKKIEFASSISISSTSGKLLLPLIIEIQNKAFGVNLYQDSKQNHEQAALQFYEKSKLFHTILKPVSDSGVVNPKLLDAQFSVIQQKLQLISNHKNQIANSLEPPSKMMFEDISLDNSNVITLVISGFLSGEDDNTQSWKGILQPGSGTVIVLHWNCSKLTDFGKDMAKLKKPKALFSLETVEQLGNVVDLIFSSNPYQSADQEAVKAGRYLAFLIAEHQLFGDCQINIVVHSLGSIILLECIRMLDKLYTTQKKQYINQIMIMGGVANVSKLQKRRWNSVAGKIYNIYSKNDLVLPYLLKSQKFYDVPCGLQQILLGYKEVINIDASSFVEGHNDYKEKLDKILVVSDFNNDLQYLCLESKKYIDQSQQI